MRASMAAPWNSDPMISLRRESWSRMPASLTFSAEQQGGGSRAAVDRDLEVHQELQLQIQVARSGGDAERPNSSMPAWKPEPAVHRP